MKKHDPADVNLPLKRFADSVRNRLKNLETRVSELESEILKSKSQVQKREPGWYPVWSEDQNYPCMCEWTGGAWFASVYGVEISTDPYPETWIIGPRMKAPGEK